MRIQNNLMAMNTHRMYTVNNNNIQKSAEKLASGYRINRAGDDAAGLAISEKMRSQIRGLGMASKNSQDAISLVQTAEGALQEVHTMLQRMNELAVQSATGTNQDFDRAQIAKEFDQLKREINDISEQTTFNNMKILDGSLSFEGPQRSAATAGIYSQVVEPDKGVTGLAVGANSASTVTTTSEVTATGSAASFSVKFDAATGAATNEKLKIGDHEFDLSALVTQAETAASMAGKIATELNGTISINGTQFTVAVDGTDNTQLNFTEVTTNGNSGFDPTTDAIVTVTGADQTLLGTTASDNEVAGVEDTVSTTTTTNGAKMTMGVNTNGLKEGDVIDITKADGSTASITLAAADIADVNSLATAIGNAFGAGYTATASGNSIVVEQTTPTAAGETIAATYTATATDKTSYIEFDSTKLRDGDTININVTLGTVATNYTYQWKDGDTIEDVYNGLGLPSDSVRKDNTITVKGDADVSGFQPRPLTDEKYGTMRIQVGALENEQLNIEVKAMNTKGLNLDDANCMTQDEAGKAITFTRAAIDKVSDQRSLLGAMQNRLEHKISNLDNTAENLQAAESRIRDVDIAKEMTTFTKNNILAQAATAMLAQANAAPQSVLSLLQ